MKYKIEKNTVQETLILPLYSRKLCTELYPNLYRDETAVHLIDQIDYDFSEAEKNSRSLMQRFGALEVAMRQNDLAFEVRAYLKTHPCAAVVNLGCGLDNTGRACDNGRCKIYNLDFPDVIALRQQLLPAGEREQNIPCDLKDPVWFDRIDASGGAVFFASGVFYYFLTQQVRELVQGMADAFPGGVLVFDAANRTAVKMIAKTWLRTAKIKDVGAYFAVSDAKSELSPWDSRLQVSSRGYMMGYNDLKDPEWFDRIDATGGAVFFASGVFYYFLTQQVKALVQGMADAFPGGVLVFDAANRTAVKMIAKTWLRTAKIKDVGAYFAVSDAKSELSPWDSRLQVSSRGYMLGYNDLKEPSVSGFFRFLARVGDNGMKMQIVKIGFGGRQ